MSEIKQLFVPAESNPDPRKASADGEVLLTWKNDWFSRFMTPAGRAALDRFMEAHGIPAGSVCGDSQVIVRARRDGSLWLDVWFAPVVGGSAWYGEIPAGVAWRRALVPLVEKVPPVLAVDVVSERLRASGVIDIGEPDSAGQETCDV